MSLVLGNLACEDLKGLGFGNKLWLPGTAYVPNKSVHEQPIRLWILESESLSVVSFPFGRLVYSVRIVGNCFAFCPEVKATVCFGPN